jgi:hypothetical protein
MYDDFSAGAYDAPNDFGAYNSPYEFGGVASSTSSAETGLYYGFDAGSDSDGSIDLHGEGEQPPEPQVCPPAMSRNILAHIPSPTKLQSTTNSTSNHAN